MNLNEPMEFTMTIEDADLDKLTDVLKDINVKECPWFEVHDKHDNKARYYREPHWTPCSERLPEREGRYIVWAVVSFTPDHVDEPCEYQQTTIASYFCDRKTWHGNNVEKVIAWMPLPSPYQTEEETE